MHGRTWMQAKQLQWQQEALQKGLQEGLQEGRNEEKFDTAKRLRFMGLSDEQIQVATELSLEEIRTL